MEDADSDSGIDSDGDWYHAGRDIVHGLRTNSHAVGPDGAHRRRFLCEEEKKGGTRWGCLSFLSPSAETGLHLLFYAETTTDLGANTPVNCKRLRMKMGRNGLVSLYFVVSLQP